MPKVKRSKKPPPEGWELIEPTLEELEQKMREGTVTYHFFLYHPFFNLMRQSSVLICWFAWIQNNRL